jgi:hypothetical protein
MTTLPPASVERVHRAIAEMRAEAGLPERIDSPPIVPLGEIIAATNLNCAEISGLTLRTAMLHLARRHTLANLPEQIDDQAPLAGFLYATLRYGTIFARQEDLIVRRRFSVAHELGHYYLHIRPSLADLRAQGRTEIYEYLPGQRDSGGEEDASSDLAEGKLQVVGGAGGLPWSSDLVEREADAFAAELLMPAMTVRLLYQRYRSMAGRSDLDWRLASEMLVSSTAAHRRLEDLHLISANG